MDRRKIVKCAMMALSGVLLTAGLLTSALFVRQAARDDRLNDDYSETLAAYTDPVSVEGIEFITQEISCGYAVIEMLGNWQGTPVTESDLLQANDGKISTSSGKGFLEELGRQFPDWQVIRHDSLTNPELLVTLYEALAEGTPIPVELAAQYDTEGEAVWTLHFAVATGFDPKEEHITVQNPYGYEEIYSVDDFLRATRYESYENMEFYFRLGFVYGLFQKNTVYTIQIQ